MHVSNCDYFSVYTHKELVAKNHPHLLGKSALLIFILWEKKYQSISLVLNFFVKSSSFLLPRPYVTNSNDPCNRREVSAYGGSLPLTTQSKNWARR